MRGAPLRDSQRPLILGIIPADAGSTLTRRWRRTGRRDHPRGCGEHQPRCACRPNGSGSSPRMRGALMFRRNTILNRGIIPADAGSTSQSPVILPAWQDHPRGCGEHIARNSIMTCEQGSSPRMRGALPHTARAYPRIGIIPADAGSTRSSRCAGSRRGDHPRGCGEH